MTDRPAYERAKEIDGKLIAEIRPGSRNRRNKSSDQVGAIELEQFGPGPFGDGSS